MALMQSVPLFQIVIKHETAFKSMLRARDNIEGKGTEIG